MAGKFPRLVANLAATALLLSSFLGGIQLAAQSVAAGTQPVRRVLPEPSADELALVEAMREPMLAGLDVGTALGFWFAGLVHQEAGAPEQAALAWKAGAEALQQKLVPLAKAQWRPAPDASLTIVRELPETLGREARFHIVEWQVDGLRQYGVLVTPAAAALPPARPVATWPLLLYLHGAAFGVPVHVLPWLAAHAAAGYVVIAPALRGEDLFAGLADGIPEGFRCDGAIENLDGEVDDALAAVAGAWKLPFVQPGKFAVLGHSFGAGVGLLAAARAPDKAACVVSYDAWLTNPFRYYWDRMRRGPNNWLSWEDFCRQPPAAQLAGLMQRSITHNAERLRCPLLLLIGGAYEGSVFHESHADLLAALKQAGHRQADYVVVPGGSHNFVLYFNSEAAKFAAGKHILFLKTHLPPGPRQLPDATTDKTAPAASENTGN